MATGGLSSLMKERDVSQTPSSGVLEIGCLSPQTGPPTSFASADNFVVQQIREAVKGGFTADGKQRTIEIVVKDTQANPNRATEVTRQLINNTRWT
jgi:branched-chain amino acid transport system substrate-binding protein